LRCQTRKLTNDAIHLLIRTESKRVSQSRKLVSEPECRILTEKAARCVDRKSCPVYDNGCGLSLFSQEATMDLGSCLTRGWEVFKKDPVPLILGSLLLIIALTLYSIVTSLLPWGLSVIAGLLPNGLIIGGWTVMAVKANREETVELQDAFKPFTDRPIDYLVVGLVMQSGIILCGIGAIVTYLIFFFAPIVVVLGADYRSALKTAKELTFTNWGEVFVLLLIFGLINICGTLACGIGLLVTIPITQIAMVNAYDQLRASTSASLPEKNPQ
jgi:hypothetical protein